MATQANGTPIEAPSPTVIKKVTHYLHQGYHDRSHRVEEIPPALGDPRWTDQLILSTWYQAEHGRPPVNGLEYRIGESGGGFDVLDFDFLPEDHPGRIADDVMPDISLKLNRRGGNGELARQIELPVPWYGGGTSYGSVSEEVMISRARAAQAWGTLTCTGEGGYPDGIKPFRDNIITQIATGLFGVREETIGWAPMIEFKYAQGAKPGLGGHLLADKSTSVVARVRESVPRVSLLSLFPYHSVYSVEDHRKHIDWARTINPTALVSVKVSTPTDVDMVAVGSYYAGAHVIHLDGAYGGTGAAPEIAKKNIAMPIEYAVPRVHRHLEAEGIRDEIVVIASGGVRSAYDIAKAIALGADGCGIGTAELVAMGCTFGLTTTDIELKEWVQPDWGAQRLDRLYASYKWQLQDILRRLGLRSIGELRGRTDLLRYVPERAWSYQAGAATQGDTPLGREWDS